MKNIVLNLAVSLDGFIEGPDGAVDWCIMDDDMDFPAFIDSIDSIFYGRSSYDAWGTYQPEEDATETDKIFWRSLHAKNKFVFSSQPREDSGATFINSDIGPRVAEIKQRGGKDVWLYGGANLIKTFIQMQLIDVYKISVHPVVLGDGKPLFEDLQERLDLKLTGTRVFRSGVVELTYVYKK